MGRKHAGVSESLPPSRRQGNDAGRTDSVQRESVRQMHGSIHERSDQPEMESQAAWPVAARWANYIRKMCARKFR